MMLHKDRRVRSHASMKRIGSALVMGLIIATLPLPGAEENQANKKDIAGLQGEWSMVSGSADGQTMPDEMRKQMNRVCKGDETPTWMADRILWKARSPFNRPK